MMQTIHGLGPFRLPGDVEWEEIAARLDQNGWARVPGMLKPDDCAAWAAVYDRPERFRSRVVMARHGFGRGEYQYFSQPLPDALAAARAAYYRRLAPIANLWQERMAKADRFPASHEAFLARCREAGQHRPTPLILRYGPGDYNCLHQDLYGEQVFPIQAACLLNAPGDHFSGGEFVLTEQRPRMQSRVSVPPLGQGDGLLFAVHQRPVTGQRGSYRVNQRHGVSEVRSGQRHVLGLIFHDAA